jgi:hypothetical protein
LLLPDKRVSKNSSRPNSMPSLVRGLSGVGGNAGKFPGILMTDSGVFCCFEQAIIARINMKINLLIWQQ